MITLLLLLCGILTIISLCITLYGISHGEIIPNSIMAKTEISVIQMRRS